MKEFQKNDMVTVTIEDIGTEGEGIGKVDGYTLFVKDAVPGDIVTAKLMKCKKNYAYARLEKVETPSPFRVEPPCPYHRQCGGCQLQAIDYKKQLEFKQQKIRGNLIRIGGFDPAFVDARMEPIIGMDEPLHYRNKAQYPVGTDRNGKIITGFYAGHTHSIIANTDCLLGAPENQQILEIILEYMREYKVSAYDETTGQGLVRHVLIRKGFTSGELMVCLVINYRESNKKNGKPLQSDIAAKKMDEKNPAAMKTEEMKFAAKKTDEANFAAKKADEISFTIMKALEKEHAEEDKESYETNCIKDDRCKKIYLPEQDQFIKRLLSISGMKSISVNINTENTNVILGSEVHTIWGEPTISDSIHVRDMQAAGYPFTGDALTFKISPLSFYQVNPVQTEKLYSLALEYAGLTGRETVWDLYCGIGTISLFMARKAKQVYGVEIVEQAILDARENAKRNGINNAKFFVGKAEEVLPAYYEEKIKLTENEKTGNHLQQQSGKITYVLQEPLQNERKENVVQEWFKKEESNMLHPDVIVVDPPRKGCDEACLSTMLKMQPSRIVYVSCDSATLARDLKILCESGYEIQRVRGVDQFGMTVHVETVVGLQRIDT